MSGHRYDRMTRVVRSEDHGFKCLGDPIKEDVSRILPLLVLIPLLVRHEVGGVDPIRFRIHWIQLDEYVEGGSQHVRRLFGRYPVVSLPLFNNTLKNPLSGVLVVTLRTVSPSC